MSKYQTLSIKYKKKLDIRLINKTKFWKYESNIKSSSLCCIYLFWTKLISKYYTQIDGNGFKPKPTKH